MHKYFSTGQYKDTIKAVHERARARNIAVPPLTFKGTVKLHGTNSSVYNVLSSSDLTVQSRNNEITVEQDNNGFARYVQDNTALFHAVFESIKKNYPEALQTRTAVVYGEWCGGKIQQKVALSELEHMFVVFAIKLIDNNAPDDETGNTVWFNESQILKVFQDIGVEHAKTLKVYNIYDFKTWEVEIDMTNPKLSQNRLIEITLEVEKQCPVALAFGVNGMGEGVVWRCITENSGIKTDDLVFKVKGKEHSVSKVTTLAAVDAEKVNSIKEFVDYALTENRLNQALEYLREQHLEIAVSNMSVFLKWVGGDCLKEESDAMEKSGLDRKDVMPAIANHARQWYFRKINEIALA